MFSAVQATEVEIGVDDASVTTSTQLPINALWKYGWSQQIYTADEIGMGGTINSITLQMYHTGSNPPAYSVNVYMMEVDDEAFASPASTTSWIPVSEDDLVFSGITFGNLPTTAAGIDAFTIELDDPFVYSGTSNLLIAFANNTGSYVSGMNSLVFGTSADNANMSLYKYTDGGAIDPTNPNVDGTLNYLRNVITLDITAGGSGVIPCEKPSGIEASNVTDVQATLTWAAGSGVYNVEYKKTADTVWTSLLENTSLFTTTLTDLEANTAYQARVQSVCAGNTDNPVSGWRTVSFKTECGFITTFPWSEDFEDAKASAVLDCWDNTGSSSYAATSTKYYIWGITGSSNKSMYMYNSLVRAGTALTISPYFVLPATGIYELSFDYVHAASCGDFSVLVSSDGLAWDTLQSYSMTTTSTSTTTPSTFPNEAIISLANYAGQTIQLQFFANANYGSGAIWVDNLAIYDASCVKPNELTASEVTTNSVDLAWEAEEGQTVWQVEYKKSDASAWTAVEATENPYTLENLEVYTAYDIRVATKCEDNLSKYSNVVSIKTAAAAPFAEAFTSLPADWKRYAVLYSDIASGEDTLTNHAVSSGWSVSTGNGVYGVNHLKLLVSGESTKNWIVSPFIEMNQAEMQLTFDLALTKSSGTLTPAEAGQQDDDKFSVLVTADGGETWEELYVRDNVTSADSYDNINCTADGQTVKINLSAYTESTIAIAFYGESTVSGGSNYLHIRNFDIDTIPSCEKPEGLAVSNVSSSAATFAWNEVEDATWAYGIVANPADNFVPTDADFTGITQNYIVTIDTLTENTPYLFFVRRACGGSNSEAISRLFLTEQTPSALPYEDGFEDGLNWVLINGDLTNQWVLSEAVNNGGTHSLYISNDNGTSNAYTNNSAALVYATKTFNFAEAGTYAVNFDWRANGESSYDLLCVALVPDGTLIEASSSVSGQWTVLPTGWTALHEGVKLNLQSSWQHSSYELNIENEGIYKIVMVWRNDGSTGTTPPAAVDNFSIELLLCPAPTELSEVAETATTNSVQLDWVPGSETNWFIQYKKAAAEEWTLFAGDVTTPPFTLTGLEASSTYNIRVAAWCDPTDSLSASDWSSAITVTTACDVISEFPFAENFDGITGASGGTTNVLPTCWSYINTSTYSSYAGYPNAYNGSSYAASGSNALKFYSYAYSSTYDPQDQYAILPEMEGISGLRMKFAARAYSTGSSYDATFTVGVMSDPTDTATFVPVATMEPAGTAYESFEVKFNTYEGTGKYIAIKMLAADLIEDDYIHGVHIDNIVIDLIPDCVEPASIQVVEVTTNSVKFNCVAAAEGDSLSYAIALPGVEPTEYTGVEANPVIVEGLEGSSEYVIYLRTECATSHSINISAVFQTKQVAVDMGSSFFEDFEGPNTWYGFNTAANAWVRGEAAHNGEGTHALYVSNDGGETNGYAKSGPGIIYGAKLLNIEGGSYVFQFDWRAKGEGTSTLYDYMRAALVPATAELVAGSTVPTGFGGTTLPEGCIAIDNSQALNQSDTWQTSTSDEVTVPAGTYYLAFGWKWDSSGGSDPAAAVDNVSITKILCGKPGTPTIEKANITSTSAEIAWLAEEGQTEWILALDTIAAFNKDSVDLQTVVTTNPYLAENLLPEHTYYVYVRANCGENGFSAWSARASFKTAKSCQKPDGLEVASITDSSAVVTWNTYGQNDFILTYGIGNAYADTVEVVGGTYTITGLEENTSYKVKVAATCDETQWTSAKTFKTACSPIAAVVENFDAITGSTSSHVLPGCWDYINGGSTYGYLPTVYNSESYANSGSNSLKFYNYASTSYKDQYAILPAVNNLNTLRMKLNARKYSASYSATVVVGIMTDPTDTATFVAIDTIRPAGVAYEPFLVSFGEYTGEGKYVALKAPLPASSYNGAHIDDIVMEAIPSCLEPTGLTALELGTDSAKLDWTSTALSWQILLNNDSLIDVVAKPFVLNELAPATTYTFAVRAICAEGDTSAWSKSAKFVTECDIISLANANYVQDFEDVDATTYNVEGVVPACWSKDGNSTYSKPHVVLKGGSYAYTHSGNQTLNFCGSSNSNSYVALPLFAEPLNKTQISFWMQTENANNGELTIGYITAADEGNFSTYVAIDTFENHTSSMVLYEAMLKAMPAEAARIAFRWQWTGSSYYSCCIDSVVVSLIPACPKTTGLEATIVGDVTASFAWDAEEDVTWEYGFVVDTVANFVPVDADFTGVATTNAATLNALEPETSYLFFIRKVCGDEKSEIIYKSFSTIMPATALPYDDDFENGNSWKLINGTCTNAWTVGTLATESGNSLYITNDGGTTYAYTTSIAATVYAVKAFNFDKAGRYTVSYDWRANGESTYDYLRVAIVPATVELAAATTTPSGFGPTGLPTGWKAADGGSKLNLSDAWASKSVIVEDIVPGYYLFVFAWRDDTSTGAQSPAAVDNIHIQHLDYPTAIGNIEGEGAQAVKFLYNDQVYILINGVVYNITGQKVEVK